MARSSRDPNVPACSSTPQWEADARRRAARALSRVLTREPQALGRPLTVVELRNPDDDERHRPDIVAVDDLGALVLIDLETCADDGQLTRGLHHVAMARRDVDGLTSRFWAAGLRRDAEIRLVLVSESFSPALRASLDFVEGLRVELFRFGGEARRPIAVRNMGDRLRRAMAAEQLRCQPPPEILESDDEVLFIDDEAEIEALELAWVVPAGRS